MFSNTRNFYYNFLVLNQTVTVDVLTKVWPQLLNNLKISSSNNHAPVSSIEAPSMLNKRSFSSHLLSHTISKVLFQCVFQTNLSPLIELRHLIK